MLLGIRTFLLASIVALHAFAPAPVEAQLHRRAEGWMRDHRYDPHGPPSPGTGVLALVTLALAGLAAAALGERSFGSPAPSAGPTRKWRSVDVAVIRVALEGGSDVVSSFTPGEVTALDAPALRRVAGELRRLRERWSHVGGASHHPMSEAMARGLFEAAVQQAHGALSIVDGAAHDYRASGSGRVPVVVLVVAATRELKDFAPSDAPGALRTLRAIGDLPPPELVRAELVWAVVPARESTLAAAPLSLTRT